MKPGILLVLGALFYQASAVSHYNCVNEGRSASNRQPRDNVNGRVKHMFEGFSIKAKVNLPDFEVRVHQKAGDKGTICFTYSSKARKSEIHETRCPRPIKGSFLQFHTPNGKPISKLCEFWAIGGQPCPKGSTYTWHSKCVSECKDLIRDQKKIKGGKVLNYAKCGKVYAITTKAEAAAVCKRNGAELASPAALKEAHRHKLNVCECGWLSDGSAKYSNININDDGCGVMNKINHCPSGEMGRWGKGPGWNVLCLEKSVCNDAGKAKTAIKGGFVINYAKCGDYYSIKTKAEAAAVCKRNNAVLATPAQLNEAHRNKMTICQCGWLSDGSVKYPNNKDGRGGCGAVNRVNNCPPNQMGIWGEPLGKGGWNAVCFEKKVCKDGVRGKMQIKGGKVVNIAKCGDYYSIKTKAEASAVCVKNGGVLASPDQLAEARKKKMNVCECGWLSDGSVRYPNTNDTRGGCGGLNQVNNCPRNQMGLWGAPLAKGGWNANCFIKN